MSTYAETLTSQTEEELYLAALADMADLGVNVAGFDPMSPNQALPRLHARALSAEQALRVLLVMAGSLRTAGTAGDSFLDALALGWFDEERIPAIAAVWDFSFAMSAGGSAYTFGTASRQVTAQADDGTTLFQNTNAAPVLLSPGASGVLVRFTCSTAGTAGNVSAGEVTTLIVKPPGASVTNASPGGLITAGRDKETNEAFVARLRGKWAARRGAAWSRSAMDYLIPFASPTLTRWRVDDANPHGDGTVELILANASDGATGPEGAAVLALIGGDDVKALGSGALTVIPADVHTVTIIGTLTCSAATLLLANAALVTFASRGDVGEFTTLDYGFLLGILTGGAYPDYGLEGFGGVTGSNITTPAGDVAGIGINAILAFDVTGLTAV